MFKEQKGFSSGSFSQGRVAGYTKVLQKEIVLIYLPLKAIHTLDTNMELPNRKGNVTMKGLSNLVFVLALICCGSAVAQRSRCVQGENCRLPSCFCPTFKHPRFSDVKDIPQMVYFGFDDALHGQVDQHYRKLFTQDRRNPNGCPIGMSLYVQDRWTNYAMVRSYYERGMEIGSHSVTHSDITTGPQLRFEAGRQRDNLTRATGIPRNKVIGWRSPNLKTAGDVQPDVLKSLGYTYDISLTYTRHTSRDPTPWPFTLDYGYPYRCSIRPCPRAGSSHPGFWEIPVPSLYNPQSGFPCAYVDSCRPDSEQAALEYLWSNFEQVYQGNRAPFGLNMHAAWFFTPIYIKAMDAFIQRLLRLPDVYVITASQVLDWMRDPVKVSEVNKLPGWGCGVGATPLSMSRDTTKSSVIANNNNNNQYYQHNVHHTQAPTHGPTQHEANDNQYYQHNVHHTQAPAHVTTQPTTVTVRPHTTRYVPWIRTQRPPVHTYRPFITYRPPVVTYQPTYQPPNRTYQPTYQPPGGITQQPANSQTRQPQQNTPFPFPLSFVPPGNRENNGSGSSINSNGGSSSSSSNMHNSNGGNHGTNNEGQYNSNVQGGKEENVKNPGEKESGVQPSPVLIHVHYQPMSPAPNNIQASKQEQENSSSAKMNEGNGSASGIYDDEKACVQEVTCVSPRCRCRSLAPPSGLRVKDTPQMVYLTFTGAVNSLNYQRVLGLLTSRKNPNGCPISATFFVPRTGNYVPYVWSLRDRGHEIAMYGNDPYVFNHSVPLSEEVQLEVDGFRRNDHWSSQGYRSPEGDTLGSGMLEGLQASGVLYDASLMTSRRASLVMSVNDVTAWPYTLDHGWRDCQPDNHNCPRGRYPGLWEVPVNPLVDTRGGNLACHFADGCHPHPVYDSRLVSTFLWENLQHNLNTYRAPLGLQLRYEWFSDPRFYQNLLGLQDFLDAILSTRDRDVYVVSVEKMLDWMRDPVGLDKIESFESWKC